MVGKPIATVKTSSPGFIARLPNFGLVSALKATRLALDPLFTKRVFLAPTNFPSLRWKSSVNLPAVNQPSRLESTKETKSDESRTFPETGTGVSPALNSVFTKYFSAYALVASRAAFLSTSKSLTSEPHVSISRLSYYRFKQVIAHGQGYCLTGSNAIFDRSLSF